MGIPVTLFVCSLNVSVISGDTRRFYQRNAYSVNYFASRNCYFVKSMHER